MRRVSHTRRPLAVVFAALLLLALSSSTAVLSQTFSFDQATDAVPWSPRNNPGALLAPHSSSADSGFLVLSGGANGRSDNDVWISQEGVNWFLQSGTSVSGDAPGAAANASFPPSAYGALAYDVRSQLSFHYGGELLVDNLRLERNDTWYSTDGLNWAQAIYTAGGPAPAYRDQAVLVASSNSQREASFLLLGGFDYSNSSDIAASSALIWKSSAVSGKPDVREWTLTGSTIDAEGNGLHSYTAPAQLDQGRLHGKDILYLLGGIKNWSTNALSSDEIWASSDEGATWAQLANSSFGVRAFAAGAVTDSGILFVAGGVNATARAADPSDLWASFDGGYSWSLCSETLQPRSAATMVYDPFGKQLLYGLGFNYTNNLSPFNDLYRADVSDAVAVARMCGTKIPAAGVGLTHWPGVVGDSSSTGGASGSSGGSSAPTAAASSSSAAASSSSGVPSSVTSIPGQTSSYQSSSSGQPVTSAPLPYRSSTGSSSSSLFSSSSSDDSGGGSGDSNDSSSSSNSSLTAVLIVFIALTIACAALAYTQYRLRVYGTVCCEMCAGVTCGQLCGETMGWGTKAWQRRSNLSDADLLKQVASDRYD